MNNEEMENEDMDNEEEKHFYFTCVEFSDCIKRYGVAETMLNEGISMDTFEALYQFFNSNYKG